MTESELRAVQKQIHQRFRATLLGVALTLPMLLVFWVFFRAAACWSHGFAGTFEELFCQNLWSMFAGYGVLLLFAVGFIHRAVPVKPPKLAAPLPEGGGGVAAAIPTPAAPFLDRVLRFVPSAKLPARQRHKDYQSLEEHAYATLHFTDWVLGAFIGLTALVLWGLPFALRHW